MKLPKRKKIKISVDNKIRAFGEEQGGKIKINVEKHKGNVKELADSVYHEVFHAKHPQATEKATYKKTHEAMKEMSLSEKRALADKVKRKTMHYKAGAVKRKFKMGRGAVEPGAMYKKYKETASEKSSSPKKSVDKISIMGLV